MFFKIF